MALKIIHQDLIHDYLACVPDSLSDKFNALKDADLSTADFSFYTSVASVFSSKIEGEDIELDSYIRYKRDGISFQPDYSKKTDDLYRAYIFAQTNPLNEQNIKNAHQLLSQHLLTKTWQGRYRTQNMYVATEDGRIEYVAAPPGMVEVEMEKFFADLNVLLEMDMSLKEACYYASMLHLVFVKIHPWNDGNGRSARLIEKWFLAEKFGEKAWFLQNERVYYQHHAEYYQNIRQLGLEYESLNYNMALPFLLMSVV
ncbi:MAG: Fic family protein [Saprospiraceae bacterium]|nr:Fic family protein [Saprospiraceae bacterium]